MHHKLFSKSLGHMLASHAISHRCVVTLACFTTASSRASFLGVQPSECQKYTEKTSKPPLTFTHAWAILPSLPGIEAIAPSSPPTTGPKLLSAATKTLLTYAFDLHFCSIIGDSCCVSCKSQSYLGFSVELRLHFLLPQSVPHPKKDIAPSFCIFSCIFSLYSTS